MTTYYYVLFIIFSVIAYMIVVDNNVSVYITLIFKILKVNTQRLFWMIRFHPRNPITNLIKRWEYDRLAKELQREMESQSD